MDVSSQRHDGARLTVSLLQPLGMRDAALSDALARFGVCERPGADALLIAGGLDVGAFLASDGTGALSADVMATVMTAHKAGRWIGAPCVALAVALRALEREVAAGAADRRDRHGDAVSFPQLRLVSTDRPLLGRSENERHDVLASFVRVLADQVKQTQSPKSP
jgi:putative intracellular protease/amidase